jgi:serine phosphatase RsbU (regulator of sigma subunit)
MSPSGKRPRRRYGRGRPRSAAQPHRQALRATTDPAAIQQAAVTALGEAMGVDRCYFARYDRARDRATVDADWHREDLSPLVGTYRLSDFGLDLDELYRPDGPLVVEDVRTAADRFSPASAAALEALGLRAAIGVPLFERGELVASLNVSAADRPRAWTPGEVELVQAVATQIRTAAEAARAGERERNIAHHLQDALRPALPGTIPGLQPAAYYQPALDEAEIGGDFYDVVSLEKGCYALVVADLSGKGLAAAAQIATVRHMLRAYLYHQGMTLAETVTLLNGALAEHGLLTGFATLFVGAYDANRRTLTYVNAGQEPGLLLRAESGEIDELRPTGPVLGGFEGVSFDERVVSLAPGDTLALFTDGLTEAGPSRRDLLELPGVEALLRECASEPSLTADEVLDRMTRGMVSFATPEGIRDDVCLIVARVEEPR